MGKHFALALQLPGYRHQRQNEKVQATKQYSASAKDVGRYGILISVLAIVAVLSYLFQVNSFSTKGYEIKTIQGQLAELKDQQRKMELEAAQLQSIQRIQTDPGIINMVPVQNVSYVQQNNSLSER